MSINKRIRQLKKKLDDSRLKPGKYINPPRNEIIEFVFSGPHEDWTITDLSEAIGLSTPTIYKWKKLVMDEQKSMFLPVVRCYLHQVLLSLKTSCLDDPKSTPLPMKSRILT